MLTKLEELIGKGHVLYDEPMKKHTTFRVGGPARCTGGARICRRCKISGGVLQK